MLTTNDFLSLAIQDKNQIKSMCRNITLEVGHANAFKYFMDLRRDLQRALAKYSKNKQDLDGIQLSAIRITRWLEIWCGQWFRSEAKKEIIIKNPKTLPAQLQRLAEHEWEHFLRNNSY